MHNLNKRNIRIDNFAFAKIKGSSQYPNLYGKVSFKQLKDGVLVTTEIHGLPYEADSCNGGIYGFHIHEGESCTGTNENPFADAKTHYNKTECIHPYHSGDMPPLFGNNGYAYMSFFTNRFTVKDIIDKVVIVHRMPDDLKTQPSGNSGEMIACGKIFAM
ncbi:MAG: superoxide dismutase family protein [Clostridia bacterium]|nr:superoxide dismutase family protein [Clostridia bacterium]